MVDKSNPLGTDFAIFLKKPKSKGYKLIWKLFKVTLTKVWGVV